MVIASLRPSTAHAQDSSWWGDWDIWDPFLDMIGSTTLYISSQIVYISGYILEVSVREMVLRMGTNVDAVNGIENAWVVLRDFSNIIFIFILLYAAIAIILNLTSFNAKKTIASLVVVALLVNFSFFFTRVVVDGSNILALQFYNSMEVVDSESEEVATAPISSMITEAVRLPSVHDHEAVQEAANAEREDVSASQILLISLLGATFMLVSSFVFLAMAALLLVRFAILIILMILSPIAFVAWVLPNTKQYAKKWWGELVNQSFFAPIMFALLYVVAQIITSDDFQTMLEPTGESTDSMASAIINPADGASILLNFGLVITLMLAVIVIAKQMGNKASGQAIKLAGGVSAGAGAFAARQTAGRAARRYRDSKFAKKFAEKSKLGQSALRKADSVSKNSMDIRDTNAVSGKYAGNTGRRRGGFAGGKERKKKKRERAKEIVQEDTKKEQDKRQDAERKKERKARLDEFKENSEEVEEVEKLKETLEGLKDTREAAALKLENLQQELEGLDSSDLSDEEVEIRKQEIESEMKNAQQQLQSIPEKEQEVKEELEQSKQEALESLESKLEDTGFNLKEEDSYEGIYGYEEGDINKRIKDQHKEAQDTLNEIKTNQVERARNFEDMIESGVLPSYGTESDLNLSGGRWKREWTAGERGNRNQSKDKKRKKEAENILKVVEKMQKEGVDVDDLANESGNEDEENEEESNS